ncbi:MAG: hypothetical protein A3E21_05220 [Sulfurimonas sp. RIFCSPHIGHO2_12_FULL_36_9]|uniref:hypothetical protein n=1 Tax=Sulfurimonas sp. RIFCSPLOWO2_12_36_12 TaxID=1802253 RepID=UPI0008B8ACC3|nr:hypothetical protein [Sulfurimonas sp. RIFCSPLOWO2_12_36_12]OHD98158.1 MAG: hypothetical protein A3E21_05220 [Sulfurimonas sp. RIFCSPHIGHO2_12_FULL_36_9]OHE00147.1 MAG: hypothetical protein A2W82_02765 [Sulfurimonas sp. RIFCSPLOWO2_12_36_12]OHE08630.1 MAG: hypothetical protein A3K14_04845 [Sulfurimonas sp. RIFCSPLOWO2_12_FULL_36_74]
MKYLLSLMLSALTLFGSDADGEKYQKVPLTVPVDFSKKGTVYETDFQAPWNIWGPLVGFYIFAGIDWDTSSSEEYKINGYIFRGHPQKITPYFKVKITLTPLGWASNDVTVWTRLIPNTDFVSEDSKKEFKDGEKIELVVSAPLYGGGYGKTLMIADLQRLRNYHVRVESLEDVELPKGVSINFHINRYDTKH